MQTWLGRRWRAVSASSLLSLAALSGCGSSPPTAPPPPPINPVDALVATLAEAACDWQARCCSPIELEVGNAFADHDDCVAHATLELQKAAASLRFGMAQNFITVDADDAKACVDQQKAQGCFPSHHVQGVDPLSAARWLQGCLGAFKGQVTAGARCTDRAECIKGTHCARVLSASSTPADGGSTGPTDTICLTNGKRGDACLVDEDCDGNAGDYCRSPDLHCAAAVRAGAKCGTVGRVDPILGDVATPSPACAPGLSCDPRAGVCGKPPQEKEECVTGTGGPQNCDPDPALDLFCASADSSGRGVCAVSGKTGDACGASGLPPCTGGLTCNQGGERGLGVCGPPPKVGSPCSLDDACESPARCSISTGLCTMPGTKAVGESCTAAADCASLNCSSAEDGVCQVVQTRLVTCSGPNVNAGATGIIAPPPGRDGGAFDAPFIVDAQVGGDAPIVIIVDASADAPAAPANDGGAHE